MEEDYAVSLKLLIFWTSQPQVWFAQAKTQFNLQKIATDKTKYYYVLSALDQGITTWLLDLINNPLETDKTKHFDFFSTDKLCKSNLDRSDKT